jgi:hypothetical protein
MMKIKRIIQNQINSRIEGNMENTSIPMNECKIHHISKSRSNITKETPEHQSTQALGHMPDHLSKQVPGHMPTQQGTWASGRAPEHMPNE